MVLAVLVSLPALGQKKKKVPDSQPSAIKLREAEFYFTEGEKYFILEDYAKALLYYQRAMEINPDNATIHYKVAEVLSRSNKQDDLLKASLSIENALKLDSSNKYFYLLAGTIYSGMARFEKAAQTYESLLREVKGTEEYLYELAAIYQYADKSEEAIKTYNRAESIFGINEISSVQKIRLYLEAGKTKEAIEEGEKLINAFPDEERYVMALAEVLAQKNMVNQAIQYLEKFTAQNPGSGNAKMLLAGLYRDSKQEQKARPLLVTLFDDPAVDLRSKLVILSAYSTELGQHKSNGIADPDKEAFALSLFENLEKNFGGETRVHIIGGDLFLSAGKPREALRQYTNAIELGDVNFEVWENLLLLEVQLDQFDNAIRHSDQALEMYPNQPMIHYYSGYAHLRKRHYVESLQALEQSKKLSGTNAALISEINTLLGDAYNATKEYDKSDKAYEDVLAYNPNSVGVLNNYSYFLALRKANLERAEKMSAQLVKNYPDNPTFLDTHAWVLYTREKFKEARKVIERAISTGQANAVHFEHYGDILFKLGDVDGAVQQWEKARGLNANSETLNKKITNRKIYE